MVMKEKENVNNMYKIILKWKRKKVSKWVIIVKIM